MASRIVVMKDGIIQQVGTPKEIYDNPENCICWWIYWFSCNELLKGKVKRRIFRSGYLKVLVVPEGKMKILREQGYR